MDTNEGKAGQARITVLGVFGFAAGLVVAAVILHSAVGLSRESEEFLYLTDIVFTVTRDIQGQTGKVKSLTDWLGENVATAKEYPEYFDGSSVASVIKGGIGNCGYQTDNIIVLAQYVGVEEYRRYWVGPDTGSEMMHAFAELVVDGRHMVFDPNALRYAEGEDGVPMSLKQILENPDGIKNGFFRRIAKEINERPEVLLEMRTPDAPMPLGRVSLPVYHTIGPTAMSMILPVAEQPLPGLLGGLVGMLLALQVHRRRPPTRRQRSSKVSLGAF